MATLKEGLSGLNAEGMVAKADFVHAKLTANAATFATPKPTLVALQAGRDTLSAAISAAEDGGRSAHQAKRDAMRSLKDLLKQEADYVANVANGDAQTILDGLRVDRVTIQLVFTPGEVWKMKPKSGDQIFGLTVKPILLHLQETRSGATADTVF